jgi:3-hydroxyisobutyrate dehydrogenase
MARVGVIGLGNIGGAIAANLVADGHAVTVHDTDAGRCAAATAAGAQAAADAAAVARASEVTFTSLPSPRIFESVAQEWLAAAAPDAVLVDLFHQCAGTDAQRRRATGGRGTASRRGAADGRRAGRAGPHVGVHGRRPTPRPSLGCGRCSIASGAPPFTSARWGSATSPS